MSRMSALADSKSSVHVVRSAGLNWMSRSYGPLSDCGEPESASISSQLIDTPKFHSSGFSGLPVLVFAAFQTKASTGVNGTAGSVNGISGIPMKPSMTHSTFGLLVEMRATQLFSGTPQLLITEICIVIVSLVSANPSLSPLSVKTGPTTTTSQVPCCRMTVVKVWTKPWLTGLRSFVQIEPVPSFSSM